MEGPSPACLLSAITKIDENYGFLLEMKKEDRRCCGRWELNGFVVPIAIIYRLEWRK